MDQKNLKLAQQDVEEALAAVEEIEQSLNTNEISNLKDKFIKLTEKVQQLEDILKTEGIL